MSKPTLDVQKIKRTTRRVQRRTRENEEKKQKEESLRAEESGRRTAGRMIKALPARIEKAAKGGEDYLLVMDLIRSEEEYRVAAIVASWCGAQGFKTRFERVDPVGSDPQFPWTYEYLVVSWG